MTYAVEMASCGIICLPSFLKFGTGVQAMLRFCLRNLAGCIVGIIDGRSVWRTPLRWLHAAYKVS
jgi:hypothetical protein